MLFETKHSKNNYCTTLHYKDIKTIPHCQSTIEFLFVRDGTVNALLNNNNFIVKKGQCIIVLPYEVHNFTTIKKSQVDVFIFSSDIVPDFYNHVKNHVLQNPVVSFEPEFHDHISEKSSDMFLKKSVIYKLASEVVKGGLISKGELQNADIMSRIILFIQENYNQQITIRDLAAHLGYSYNYTSHIFKELFPQGFCEMVNIHRLEEVISHLKNHETNMTLLASESGFSTIRSFNQSFKKHYGMSPRDYYNLKFRNKE